MTKNQLPQSILEVLDLEGFPPEEQGLLINQVNEMLFDAITLRALEEVSEENKGALEKLSQTENVSFGDLFTELENLVPNFQTIVQEETDHLKKHLQESFDAE